MSEEKREEQAEEFACRFRQAYGLTFDPENIEALRLRASLIIEETDEVGEAVDSVYLAMQAGERPSKEEVAHLLKELADLQYVLSGFAVAFGLPLQAAVDEVHESNMTKIGDDGMAKYSPEGKVLKGPHYRPADMEAVIDEYLHTNYKKEDE